MEDCGGVTIKFPTAESKSDKVKERKNPFFPVEFEIVIDKYICTYVYVGQYQRSKRRCGESKSAAFRTKQ